MRIEWFRKIKYPELRQESDKLLRLPVFDDRFSSSYISPDASSFGIACVISIDTCFTHWSRQFEYPWVIVNGDFRPSQTVLDAGGAKSILPYRLDQICGKVIVADLDLDGWNKFSKTETHKRLGSDLYFECCDISKTRFPDNYFDRITCISVLEHAKNPLEIVKELWRILKSKGRIIITLDVSSFVRHNHTIDLEMAEKIALFLGMKMPDVPNDVVEYTLSEYKPEANEPKIVTLKVLAMCKDKQ